jgi:cytochrome c-type biogenesis protein
MEDLLIAVNGWMTGDSLLSAAGCFIWGLVSVLMSPCHLASIPLVIAYVGGQETAVNPRQAGVYALLFSMGLFITIAVIGVICALLGRMLGDVGIHFQVVVGFILIWVALGMLGVESCSMSGGLLYRLNFRGRIGAFVLGLAYGVLSGTCTFGFIAPILAIVTVQSRVITGVALIILFALGHCLPIVIAGSSMALVRRILENRVWRSTGNGFRKGAGIVIAILGIYFIVTPFVQSS